MIDLNQDNFEQRPGTISDEEALHAMFRAALASASPEGKFDGLLPEPAKGRTIVVGAGKAAARMAHAFESAWKHPCVGLVVTRYGHAMPTRFIEVVEAGHPVPDAAGLEAAERIFSLVRSAGPDDLVIALISGGASSLLTMPAPGVTLADKQEITQALLRSGATIDTINRVRKSLSMIKGGRLAAAAAPARLVTYIISDVPGDDPATVGSGPTIYAPSDADGVLKILGTYGIPVSKAVERAIATNSVAASSVPKGEVHILATPKQALDAAASEARRLGLTPLILGDAIEGEAREVATVMAGIARSVLSYGQPAKRPCVLLSGGETTVTVRGGGRGGRNAEFLLALTYHLRTIPGIAAIACDTDGIDGSEDNAGAWIGDAMTDEAVQQAATYLANNDAYTYFKQLGRLVMTGPTLTNVNDFRAVMIR